MPNNKSSLISSLFNTEKTLSSLISQSNKLAKLTGEACLIGQSLKQVLFVCNSEIMVTAFSQIVKGINPSVTIETIPVSSYVNIESDEALAEPDFYDAIIMILSDSADIKRISDLVPTENKTKTFLIVPQSFRLPNLSKLTAEVILTLESNASDIRDAFLRGIQGETFQYGFTSEIDKTYMNLTPKQKEVLSLVCLGKSNKEISREMGICAGTVKVHLNTIFRELGVDNRIQAATLLSA